MPWHQLRPLEPRADAFIRTQDKQLDRAPAVLIEELSRLESIADDTLVDTINGPSVLDIIPVELRAYHPSTTSVKMPPAQS
ncbi:hypothetical protein [Mycobacterium sp.]|uniref:hypothetical protein n=1 Tax=Mycobacterium sp. TaxID=1785 RepID=UPI003BAC27E5